MTTNRDIRIRKGRIDDSEALLTIQKEVVREEEYLVTASEEFIDKTVEDQKKWMKKILEDERGTIIVAESGESIVGWLVFQSPNRKRLAHTGSFGMMIDKASRGLGIGKMLIHDLLSWAEQNPFIEKVSLGVFSTNQRAIALYKHMGFIEEGRKVNEVKLGCNRYVDDILMYKFV